MSTVSSFAGDAIRRAYIDEATKNVMLGGNLGNSFGLPISRAVQFTVTELEAGPIEIVPAMAGQAIVPFQAVCAVKELIPADVSAVFGWLAPEPPEGEEREDSQLWLSATPIIALGGDDSGSVIYLPNDAAAIQPTLCPGCLTGRALVLNLPESAPAADANARSGLKRTKAEPTRGHKHTRPPALPRVDLREGEEPPEPQILVVVYYTIV